MPARPFSSLDYIREGPRARAHYAYKRQTSPIADNEANFRGLRKLPPIAIMMVYVCAACARPVQHAGLLYIYAGLCVFMYISEGKMRTGDDDDGCKSRGPLLYARRCVYVCARVIYSMRAVWYRGMRI